MRFPVISISVLRCLHHRTQALFQAEIQRYLPQCSSEELRFHQLSDIESQCSSFVVSIIEPKLCSKPRSNVINHQLTCWVQRDLWLDWGKGDHLFGCCERMPPCRWCKQNSARSTSATLNKSKCCLGFFRYSSFASPLVMSQLLILMELSPWEEYGWRVCHTTMPHWSLISMNRHWEFIMISIMRR